MIDSASEFIRLRCSENKEEYDRAAHEEVPLAVCWELVRDHPDMKVWVVQNKNVPLEILEALSTDADVAVRSRVAGKRRAPPEVLERLARDVDSGVRNAVANNKKTPATVLALLLDDEWEDVAANAKARLSELTRT